VFIVLSPVVPCVYVFIVLSLVVPCVYYAFSVVPCVSPVSLVCIVFPGSSLCFRGGYCLSYFPGGFYLEFLW
jgi:hypothetical protein